MSLDLEATLQLTTPDAYPHDPSARAGVQHLQTHLSHVFLTALRVYKFRKAVDLGFVCFLSLEERNADCLRELALNRRLAPDVYQGVSPLLREDGGLRVGPVSEELREGVEHCVVMRRLPEGRDALSLLRAGVLEGAQLERLARCVARFHEAHGLGRPAPFSQEGWRQRVQGPIEVNERVLAESPEVLSAEPVSLLAERERAQRQTFLERVERRRQQGRAVDGHGDLHLQHVWLERADSEPLLIDCIEFSDELRHIDAASEVAFPSMDLRYRGQGALAELFLRHYARERDDFDLYGVVDAFESYRAAVRAKVAALAARDDSVGAEQRLAATRSAREHLELAVEGLAPRPAGRVWLVGGVVGTGKSTAAEIVADVRGGAVVASDRVRKGIAGFGASERPDPGLLYDPEHTERTYAGLLDRARPVAASGRDVVLDATFSSKRHREAAQQLATELGSELVFLETRCAADVAIARLARRQAAGLDPSDAGPERHRHSVAGFEPVSAGDAVHELIHTDAEDWRGILRRRVAHWG